jgi:hypothetical protein
MPTIAIALHRALAVAGARAARLYGHAGMAGRRGDVDLAANPRDNRDDARDDNLSDSPAAHRAANPAAPPAAPPARRRGRRSRPAQPMKAP